MSHFTRYGLIKSLGEYSSSLRGGINGRPIDGYPHNTICPRIGAAQWACYFDECTCHRKEFARPKPQTEKPVAPDTSPCDGSTETS